MPNEKVVFPLQVKEKRAFSFNFHHDAFVLGTTLSSRKQSFQRNEEEAFFFSTLKVMNCTHHNELVSDYGVERLLHKYCHFH